MHCRKKAVTDEIGMMQLGFAMNVVFAMVVCENMVTSVDVQIAYFQK